MDQSKAMEEITFIKKVITDSQQIFVNNGRQYILWSSLAILGILLKYINDLTKISISALWIWIPILFIGWLSTFILKKRFYKELPAKTFVQKIFDGSWTALAVAFPILCLVGFYTHAIQPWAVPSVIATIFGCGYFITGILSDSLWIKLLAVCWWIFAIVMFLIPGEHSVPLLGLMLILFQLIPGILIYVRWKKKTGI